MIAKWFYERGIIDLVILPLPSDYQLARWETSCLMYVNCDLYGVMLLSQPMQVIKQAGRSESRARTSSGTC